MNSYGKIVHQKVLAHYQDGGFKVIANLTKKYDEGMHLVWPGGTWPTDSPKCGWDGELCTTKGIYNKPVLSGHSKGSQKIGFKTNFRLMHVKSIAECSKRAFCNTFDFH